MPRAGLTGAQAQHIIFQLFPPEVPATVAILGVNPEEFARQRAEREAFAALPLIEQNAKKIADLEREWSALGPLREITFTVKFRVETGLEALAQAARHNGFNVDITSWAPGESFRFTLEASRKMEPSAQEVTRWESWFEGQASSVPDFCEEDWAERPGAELEGWSYPKKLTPTFMLEGNPKQKRNWHIAAASKRTRILFGEALCDFEASNGWADREGSRQAGAFQLVPTKFIETAQRRRPRNPEPTASGFAQWLYSLYSDAYGRDQDRERGKLAEQEILAERSRAFSATDNQTMRKRFPDWRLVHNGMNIGKDEPPRYFEIKELSVGGQALRVLPDLIFENIDSGARIIVEVKHSYMTIPTNIWPNIWGQLWCYSQLADIKSSPSVTVVGEVWGDKTYYRGGDRCVYLRASVRRNPRASTFDQFFRVLFDSYRGA